MNKIFLLLPLLFLLNGCFESIAMIGSGAAQEKYLQSSLKSAVSLGVKQRTGKSPSQHAIAYIKEHNPENKKENCIGIKSTNSKACTIANKKVAFAKSKVKQVVEKKKISFKKMFAEARKAGKKSFIFNNKIYSTSFKN